TAWSNRWSSVGCCKSGESALSCASVHARITGAWKPTPGLNWEAPCWLIDLCSTSRVSISRSHRKRRLPDRRAKRGGASAISRKSRSQRAPGASLIANSYWHVLATEIGAREFQLPGRLVWLHPHPDGMRLDRCCEFDRAGGCGAASAFPPSLIAVAGLAARS